jgi:hypothetical protein
VRILFSAIERNCTPEKLVFGPVVLRFEREEDQQTLLTLYKSLADGVYIEARIVADTPEMLETLRGLLQAVGYPRKDGPKRAPADAEYGRGWLFQEGDECYGTWAGHEVFVCPEARPGDFATS